jgi:hypothetical protein
MSEIQPLVSIVIPTRNRSFLTRFTLESVSAQTYENIEAVVVDDGGTDDTADVVARLSALDPRIRYVRNEEPRGPGGARNRGAEESRGELLSFLDSDDLLHREKVRVQVEALQADPGLDVVACQTQVFHRLPGDSDYLWNTFRSQDTVLMRLCKGNLPFQIGALMLRRGLFEAVGGFAERFVTSEDTDFCRRFMLQGAKLQMQPYVMVFYRQHGLDQSSRSPGVQLASASGTLALRLLGERIRAGCGEDEVNKELLICVLRAAHRCCRDGDPDEGRELVRGAATVCEKLHWKEPVEAVRHRLDSRPTEFDSCFEPLEALGLGWASRKKWWRVHTVKDEPLEPAPTKRRYRRGDSPG